MINKRSYWHIEYKPNCIIKKKKERKKGGGWRKKQGKIIEALFGDLKANID